MSKEVEFHGGITTDRHGVVWLRDIGAVPRSGNGVEIHRQVADLLRKVGMVSCNGAHVALDDDGRVTHVLGWHGRFNDDAGLLGAGRPRGLKGIPRLWPPGVVINHWELDVSEMEA